MDGQRRLKIDTNTNRIIATAEEHRSHPKTRVPAQPPADIYHIVHIYLYRERGSKEIALDPSCFLCN